MTWDKLVANLDNDQLMWLVRFRWLNIVLFFVSIAASSWTALLSLMIQYGMLRWADVLIQVAVYYRNRDAS